MSIPNTVANGSTRTLQLGHSAWSLSAVGRSPTAQLARLRTAPLNGFQEEAGNVVVLGCVADEQVEIRESGLQKF